MTKVLYIYLTGVLLAFILLAAGIERLYRKGTFLFVPKEAAWLLSSLSWVLVAVLAWGWLLDFLTYIYVYIVFKYKVWQNKKNDTT